MSTFEKLMAEMRLNVREPDMYDVVLLNDDFTPMDFVVNMLRRVFFIKEEEAMQLMLRVHNQGSGVAGTYVFDMAISKRDLAIAMARSEGYPLRINIEKRDRHD